VVWARLPQAVCRLIVPYVSRVGLGSSTACLWIRGPKSTTDEMSEPRERELDVGHHLPVPCCARLLPAPPFAAKVKFLVTNLRRTTIFAVLCANCGITESRSLESSQQTGYRQQLRRPFCINLYLPCGGGGFSFPFSLSLSDFNGDRVEHIGSAVGGVQLRHCQLQMFEVLF